MIEIHEGSPVVIVLSDRLDSMNADEAKEIVTTSLKNLESDIVLDVNNLGYISSAGLQVVLKCAKIAQEYHKECFLRGANGTVREIFQVSGFLTFIKELE